MMRTPKNALAFGTFLACFGEKSPEEKAMALSASDAVHRFSVGTAQNTGIPSGRTAIGE
jgi:hypothetical protein